MSQSPSGDFLLGRSKGDTPWAKNSSQSPSGDFLLGRNENGRNLDSVQEIVSIPLGGFFVGKCRKAERRFFHDYLRLNPPRGIFCWEGAVACVVREDGQEVSIPLGGFFVGKDGWELWHIKFLMPSLNPPRGIFCWEDISQKEILTKQVKGLNPPRGIFCWEVQSYGYAGNTWACLNPPRGIFCWEAFWWFYQQQIY